MKKLQILFTATLCGVLFGMAVKVSADTGNTGYATVVRVDGPVSYSLGDDKWIPLVGGKILPVGSTIRTGDSGTVDIVLGKDIDLPQNSWQGRWEPSHVAPAPDSSVRGLVSVNFRSTRFSQRFSVSPSRQASTAGASSRMTQPASLSVAKQKLVL